MFLALAPFSGGLRFEKERETCFGEAGAEGTVGKQEAFLFRALKTRCIFFGSCSDRALAERGGAVAGRRRGTPVAHSGEDDQVTGPGVGVRVCRGREAAGPPGAQALEPLCKANKRSGQA